MEFVNGTYPLRNAVANLSSIARPQQVINIPPDETIWDLVANVSDVDYGGQPHCAMARNELHGAVSDVHRGVQYQHECIYSGGGLWSSFRVPYLDQNKATAPQTVIQSFNTTFLNESGFRSTYARVCNFEQQCFRVCSAVNALVGASEHDVAVLLLCNFMFERRHPITYDPASGQYGCMSVNQTQVVNLVYFGRPNSSAEIVFGKLRVP